MGVSDKWPNFHFGVEYPFKAFKSSMTLNFKVLILAINKQLTTTFASINS